MRVLYYKSDLLPEIQYGMTEKHALTAQNIFQEGGVEFKTE